MLLWHCTFGFKLSAVNQDNPDYSSLIQTNPNELQKREKKGLPGIFHYFSFLHYTAEYRKRFANQRYNFLYLVYQKSLNIMATYYKFLDKRSKTAKKISP